MDQLARLAEVLADRYRIEREIGAGGMATVFLAHDLRHDRRVAIKVLRPELSAVLGAERFLAEIKVTANLQHPHILPLHDSGAADGVLFYVMPYVEGESLRDRLDRETQLSIEDAFQIAQEVADGLSHAHGLGVIHRDIKPENILLSGGHALIADFGIARAVTEAGGSRLTETGLSLGTPHYMSPEQAAGDSDVGTRSDLYALGCVLYEMLVGEPPHTGPNAQAIIAKVLTEDAPSARKSRELLSPQADAVIQKALAKLPADRFASVQDFSEALKRAGTGGWETTGGFAGSFSEQGPVAWSTKFVWSLMGAVAVFAVGLLLWPQASSTSSLSGVARTTLMPRPADSISVGVFAPTSSGAEVGTLAISDDGRRVAFVGKISGEDATSIFVRDLEHSEAVPLPGTESGASPFFSPDGEWLGFYSWTDGRLKMVPATGGAPQVICECDPILTADWGPDGIIVMDGAELGGLRLVDAAWGTPELAVSLDEHKEDPEYGFQHPHFLPDGRHIVFSAWGGAGATRRLVMFSLDTGDRTTLFQDGWAPRYVKTGHILFLRTDQIWALPFDADRLEVGETALPVVDSVNAVQFQTLFGVSDEGTLVYAPGPAPEWGGGAYMVDQSGQRERLFPAEGNWPISGPTLSPDGTRIAFWGTDPTGYSTGQTTAKIWIHHILQGTTEALLESGGPGDFWPLWDPDGRSVVFTTARSGEGYDLYRAFVGGSGESGAIYTDGAIKNAHSWLPNGTGLIFQSAPDFQSDFDIWLLPLEGDGVPVPLVENDGNDVHPALSPNGQWLAYASDRSGRYEIYLRRFPDLDEPIRVSTSGGMGPLWREDSRELYFYQRSHDGGYGATFMKVPVDDGPGPPEALWSDQRLGLGVPYGKGYDVTPDGQRMLVAIGEQETSLFVPELRIVFNWFDELNARFER